MWFKRRSLVISGASIGLLAAYFARSSKADNHQTPAVPVKQTFQLIANGRSASALRDFRQLLVGEEISAVSVLAGPGQQYEVVRAA